MNRHVMMNGKKIPLCVHCIHCRMTECYVELTNRRMELPFCHVKKMVIHDCECITDCSAFRAVIPEMLYEGYFDDEKEIYK